MKKRSVQLSEGLKEAAIRWWKSRRPVGWTVTQHLANACVNTRSEAETDLCWAIAKVVAAESRPSAAPGEGDKRRTPK